MTLLPTVPKTADDRVIPFPRAAPDIRPVGPDVLLDVKPEQIRLLGQHPSLILVNLINALLVVVVLWSIFRRDALLGWYGLFALVVPARLVLARMSRRRGWSTNATASLAVIGSAVTGAIWGLLAWPVIAIPDLTYPVFIVFALGGMTAGANLLAAPYLPAFFAFVVPIVAPTTLAYAARGDRISVAMGIMLAAFATVQAIIGLRTNRWIIDTLRLQVQRENLTADLYRTTAELTRREAILQIMANHDQLTGLFNRYYLLETLGRELSRVRRLGLPITVALLDIDHFKDYNDNFGHQAGDEVLREIGTMLKNTMRASDIVCRYGGEEFLIVFLDSPAAAVLPRLNRISLDIKQRQYVYHGDALPSVTLSVGVAEYPHHGRSVDDLIRSADRALYAAKKAGRDRIEVLSGGRS